MIRLNKSCYFVIIFSYNKTDINNSIEIAAIDKMSTYGSDLTMAKLRNISAVSLTLGKGVSGFSTLRNSHKGPQPSLIR